jgi:hypothetical protein
MSEIPSYQIQVNESREPDELNNINMILMSLDQSPLKSQSTIRLEKQTPASIRRLTSKLRRIVSVTGNPSFYYNAASTYNFTIF